MNYIRLYTGDDGESHFEKLEIDLSMNENVMRRSISESALGVEFGEIPEGAIRSDGRHNAPARQYVIILEGSIEVEIGNGQTELINAGGILLAEDLTGKGHITRNPGNNYVKYLLIKL